MKTFTKSYNQVCGIDVSKDLLDYCIVNEYGQVTVQRQLSNDLKSIEGCFSLADYDDTLFVLEYTGTYSSKLLYQLSQLARSIRVLSPHQSKQFMSILGHSNKTDKQAAYALSLAGRTLDLKPYTAPTREMEERKQLMSSIGALEKQERMLLNQIHALEQLPFINEQAMNSLKQVLEMVKEQIKPLKEQLYNDAEDKEFTKKKHLISSVVGIGNKTAEAILLVTNGLNNFNSAGQVAKFLGITPYSQESGTSVKVKGRITKKGSHEVRSLLYMCAVSAVKHNLACKELFERMRKNGKPYKVAMVAVMHKLVKQLFACVKKEIPFDNEFHLKENKKAKK